LRIGYSHKQEKLAALAGCQTITIKMVAASMGVILDDLRVTVTGEMDFRGTMGIDHAVPIGYTQLHCDIAIQAAGDPDRLHRLVERAEQFCVVRPLRRAGPGRAGRMARPRVDQGCAFGSSTGSPSAIAAWHLAKALVSR